MKQEVMILGTAYQLQEVSWDGDELLRRNNWVGYCNELTKTIVYAQPESLPDADLMAEFEKEAGVKQTLRHEIIHAFLNESGLRSSSLTVDMWARNEEMIDFFAIQLPKIFAVYQELDILT